MVHPLSTISNVTSVSLFAARTTDGNSTGVAWSNTGDWWFDAYGTWDGATMKLQYSPDSGTTWVDAADTRGSAVSFTANGGGIVRIPWGHQVRANLSNDGASTSLTAKLTRLA